MRIGRLAVPIALISALILLGGLTAGLILARDQAPHTPALPEAAVSLAEPTPTAEPTPLAEPTPTAEPTLTAQSTAGPAATATPIPLKLPELPEKSQPLTAPPEPSTKGARSEQEVSAQGTAYTWEDGDRTLTVVLQRDLVVQETAANTPEDVVVAGGARDSIVQKQPEPSQDARPVFRSESGGGLMTLPGGVLLALDPEWDEAGVESFFSRNNISKDRTSELGFLDNGFLVETEPGFPSLELANALASQDGVVMSTPNWWTEVEAK